MQHKVIGFLVLACITSANCTRSNKSEIIDPCLIIQPESEYVPVGGFYKIRIILTCNKPDSFKQITINTDPVGESYFEKGEIYWKYKSSVPGKVTLKGEVIVKNDNGNIQTLPFESQFYFIIPHAVISNNNLNYLIKDTENHISIAAPGFPSSELKLMVPANKANVKMDQDYGEPADFVVIPTSYDTIKLTVYVPINGRITSLGTYSFNVLDKNSIKKDKPPR